MKPILKTLIASTVLVAASHSSVVAQIVTNDPTTLTSPYVGANPLTLTTGKATPGLVDEDLDGYYLFDASNGTTTANFNTLPSSVVTEATETSINLDSYTPGVGGNYSEIKANGTTYETGISYFNPAPNTTSALITAGNGYQTPIGTSTQYTTIATLTLGANVPEAFTIGLLTGNTNTNGNSQLFQVVGANSDNVNSTYDVNTKSNDFYYLDVTGATAGEVLDINVGNDPSHLQNVTGISAITFSSAPIPEPSTYALVLAGAGALVVMRRSQRRNA